MLNDLLTAFEFTSLVALIFMGAMCCYGLLLYFVDHE